MNSDLENSLNELGGEYRGVVSRLKRARTANRPFAFEGWLIAASLCAIIGMVTMMTRLSAPSIPREYSMSVEEMIASQNEDGGWANDFLTRRNAEALKNRGGSAAMVAYKKAMRNLRLKGLL